MYEIIDDFCWEKHKKVLTFDNHNVIGLKNFSYWNLARAITPTPLHYHSDIMEFHCLVKGMRFCQVGETPHTITGNEVFTTFPYEMHSTGTVPQHPCEFYGFQIDLKHKDNLLGLNKHYSNYLHDELSNLPHRHLKISSYDVSCLKKAFSYFSTGLLADQYLGVQHLCCFLFHISSLSPINTEEVHSLNPAIQKAINFIEKNFKEPLYLKDLAEISSYSLSRFKIKFKEEVGITPADFISLTKIEYARRELLLTDKSITELAFELGFSSSNYFCSVFKKLSNCGPKEYRKLAGDIYRK